MRRSKHKISIPSFFPILGFVILLLLAPCKVRNAVQVLINVTPTEVTNLSQTVTKSKGCHEIDNAVTNKNLEQFSFQSSPTVLGIKLSFIDRLAFDDGHLYNISRRAFDQHEKIPLYLLYGNFKDCL